VELSSLLAAAESGDPAASDTLFAALYAELHRLARRQLRRGGADLTLGTTSLLHEAFMDMAGREQARFADRARFMAYAAKVMRTLIIDYARGRKAQKRGGQFELVAMEGDLAGTAADGDELARIGTGLDALATAEPLLAQVVDLKFFCGFSFAEIAAMLGLGERTVQRHWERARIYLHGAIRDADQ